MNNNQCASTTNTGLPPVTRARPRKNSCVADDDPAIHGTEMVMLYDYKVCVTLLHSIFLISYLTD